MLTRLVNPKHHWVGVLALLVSYFIVNPMVAPLFAQTAIMGELEFLGASKVERSSGVWIDGQYVGYLGELKGHKKILLLPGDHDLAVRQAGYQDFTRKLTVEPNILLSVPVKMEKATNEMWPP